MGLIRLGPLRHSVTVPGAVSRSAQITQVVGTAPGQDGGTLLLSEGFDDTSLSARGWYDQAATPTISATEQRTGAGCLACGFAQTGTAPAWQRIRHLHTTSDVIRLSFWIKHSSNYVGSGLTYHPHLFHCVSDADNDWTGLSLTYLGFYVEFTYDGGLIPRLVLQDSLMIDTDSIGSDPGGENVSCAGANGNRDGTGVVSYYQIEPGVYYNAKTWDAASVAISEAEKVNWHYVEAYCRLNSIVGGVGQYDGQVRCSVDGTEVIALTGLYLRAGGNPATGFHQLAIAPFIGDGSPVAQTIWIDDLALYVGSASFPNEPAGYTRISLRPFGNINPTTDDSIGTGTWVNQQGTPYVVSDAAEPGSPPTAYRWYWLTNDGAGGGNGDPSSPEPHPYQEMTFDQDYTNAYIAYTVKLPNWDNTLFTTKHLWLYADESVQRGVIMKGDGYGTSVAPEVEGYGYALGTLTLEDPNWPDAGERAANIGGAWYSGEDWHTVEVIVNCAPTAHGTARFRTWVDGVSTLDAYHWGFEKVRRLAVQPFIGGTGTYTGSGMQLLFGHLIIAVS